MLICSTHNGSHSFTNAIHLISRKHKTLILSKGKESIELTLATLHVVSPPPKHWLKYKYQHYFRFCILNWLKSVHPSFSWNTELNWFLHDFIQKTKSKIKEWNPAGTHILQNFSCAITAKCQHFLHTLDTHTNLNCLFLQCYILFFECIVVMQDKARYSSNSIKINLENSDRLHWTSQILP